MVVDVVVLVHVEAERDWTRRCEIVRRQRRCVRWRVVGAVLVVILFLLVLGVLRPTV